MHLLTGLLVGEMLLGSRLLRGEAARPPLELLHVLPGRLRVRLAGLKGDTDLARRLVAALEGVDGVRDASADVRSGNALVSFDDSRPTRERLIETFRGMAQDPPTEADDAPDEGDAPLLLQQIRKLGRQADRGVMTQSQGVADARTLMALAAGAWGLKSMAYPGAVSRWQGLTLCYWSFNMLKR